jgi:hypothetical protein
MFEHVVLYLTWKCIFVIHDFSSRKYGLGKRFLILYSRPVCHTLSNASVRSRNVAVQRDFSSRLAEILFTILFVC